MKRLFDTIDISPAAEKTLQVLEANDHEAWCVGGCVRDALLKRATNDYDVATSASWQEAERLLQQAGFAVRRSGVKHGTITAVLDKDSVEVTTFRHDGAYSDGRHPDDVVFVKHIEEDLKRRDFTMNALAYHPARGILDCVGGLEDLQNGIIRVVGDPKRRFREDGLRVLRGCRFASQLGFTLEDDTLRTMKSFKMMLYKVSVERITHELDGLLLGQHVHDALVQTIDVLGAIMPEIVACKGFDQHSPYHIYDVWEHTAWVVQNAPQDRLVRWAALLHDIGKPAACFFEGDRAHFYGHARLSALMARNILQRLTLSPAFARDVVTLVELHDNQIPPTSKNVKHMLHALDDNVSLFEALVHLKRADALAHSERGIARVKVADDLASTLEAVIRENDAFSVRQLAIDGHDMMEAGIPSGPEVGKALECALNGVIDEHVANERDALLAYVREKTAIH